MENLINEPPVTMISQAVDLSKYILVVFTTILLPWCIWVTINVFNIKTHAKDVEDLKDVLNKLCTKMDTFQTMLHNIEVTLASNSMEVKK